MKSQADKEAAHAETEARFKAIFTAHYNNLRYYAFSILKNEVLAEEAVQNVFCRIWENGHVNIEKVTQAYLYRSVHNESLNFLKKEQVKARHEAQWTNELLEERTDNVDYKALYEKAQQALSELPEQCRTIFQLSRMEQMKYREIAERLGISAKTVEAQMSKALRILRVKLADFLPVLFLFLISIQQ
jgi:RNA polymerase sigma-70 factor (ECF subfamily)